MRVCDCRQGSLEWFECRMGRPTASRACDWMAKLKNGASSKRRQDYAEELFTERIIGKPCDHFVSSAMRWGSEVEPFARTAYELHSGEVADIIGFVFHPTLDFTGASPDALIGEKGGLEIKAPTTLNHLTWLKAGVVPPEHVDQMQWNMACAEREWFDFCSFDPRVPKHLRLFGRRLMRDDKRIAEIEREVIKLHAEVDYAIAELGAESILPPIESFIEHKAVQDRNRMVMVGDLEVPEDVMDALGDKEWRI